MAAEPEAAFGAASIQKRAGSGAWALLARQVVLLPVGIISGVVLARLMGPEVWGAYASVSILVMGAGLFGDWGLGAWVVQRPEEPSPHALRAVFTLQLLLMSALALLLCLVAPWVAEAFRLPPEGAWWLRLMALHLVVGSLGLMPTLLLERRLGFGSFARIDVATVLVDRGLALALAFAHMGVWAFLWAGLASMAVRAYLLARVVPWAWGFAWDPKVFREASGFGLAVQGSTLSMVLRDHINAWVGGPMAGPHRVGLLNWGSNQAQTLSNPVVQALARVGFPAMARLQEDAPARAQLLGQGLAIANLVVLPALTAWVTLGDHVVTFLYGDAWRGGLAVLGCFAFRTAATNITSALVGHEQAMGRAKGILALTGAWTLLELAGAVAAAWWWGWLGIALAAACLAWPAALYLMWRVGRELSLPWGRILVKPAFVCLAVFLAADLVVPLVDSLAAFLAALAWTAGVGIAGAALLDGELVEQALSPVARRLGLDELLREENAALLPPPEGLPDVDAASLEHSR